MRLSCTRNASVRGILIGVAILLAMKSPALSAKPRTDIDILRLCREASSNMHGAADVTLDRLLESYMDNIHLMEIRVPDADIHAIAEQSLIYSTIHMFKFRVDDNELDRDYKRYEKIARRLLGSGKSIYEITLLGVTQGAGIWYMLFTSDESLIHRLRAYGSVSLALKMTGLEYPPGPPNVKGQELVRVWGVLVGVDNKERMLYCPAGHRYAPSSGYRYCPLDGRELESRR